MMLENNRAMICFTLYLTFFYHASLAWVPLPLNVYGTLTSSEYQIPVCVGPTLLFQQGDRDHDIVLQQKS